MADEDGPGLALFASDENRRLFSRTDEEVEAVEGVGDGIRPGIPL
jgi:hypothetical protein